MKMTADQDSNQIDPGLMVLVEVLMVLAARAVPRFLEAPLTFEIIQRRNFQMKTNFKPRKGFDIICRFPDKDAQQAKKPE
jgi:hypothetical protein